MVDNNFFFETPCGVHFSVLQVIYRSNFYDKLAEIYVKLTIKVDFFDEKGWTKGNFRYLCCIIKKNDGTMT
ncbi:MAG: hypothetical protein IKV37_04340, partial [Prevotella sp.]|nr:hypothetical protein [Prevotella sp.]